MKSSNLIDCSHICPLKVGSSSHDETRMMFNLGSLEYKTEGQNPVLDYIIQVEALPVR